MNRIDRSFERLRAERRKALMPFITAGDPDLAATARLIEEFSRRGASLIEIGIPYSDPIADGPVIQASYTRALERRVKLSEIFAAVAEVASKPHVVPLVAMVSYAIVFRHGLERFVGEAKRAGFEGAIVPDLPVEESAELAEIAAHADFKLILLVTPTTPPDRAREIARVSTGFLYYVSVTGITGERDAAPKQVLDQAAHLRTQTQLPICIGFGISRTDHIRALAPAADGLIVGSAIVRRIADSAAKPRDEWVHEIGDYVESLVRASQVLG